MSTLLEDWPEPDNESVARRLRMHMGDLKISRAKLAFASGIKRSTLSLKLDNDSEFTLAEIMMIAHALNRSWVWVLTGREPSSPDPDDGSRLGESNPRPIHYGIAEQGSIADLSKRIERQRRAASALPGVA